MNKQFFPFPNACPQAIDQLSQIQLLFSAASETNNFEAIIGLRYLAAFLGCSVSSARRKMRSGRITGYKIDGSYFFLVHDVINAINEDPLIARSNWLSYEDLESSPDELKIHWRKFNWPGRVLVKFTYLGWTSFLSLPPEMWRRNSKIIRLMLKAINERNKIYPFIHQNKHENE